MTATTKSINQAGALYLLEKLRPYFGLSPESYKMAQLSARREPVKSAECYLAIWRSLRRDEVAAVINHTLIK